MARILTVVCALALIGVLTRGIWMGGEAREASKAALRPTLAADGATGRVGADLEIEGTSRLPVEAVVDPGEEHQGEQRPEPSRPVLEGMTLESFVRALPDAEVKLFLTTDTEPIPLQDSPSIRVDDQGRFRVSLPLEVFDRELLLVAVTQGFRPTAQLLHPQRGRPLEKVTLILDPGEAVSGRILLEGMPLSSTDLWLRPLGIGRPEFPGSLLWVDDHFEPSEQHSNTDREGSFEFRGLAPRSHELSILLPGISLPRVTRHVLPAPTRGRTIDVRPGHLMVRVLKDGEAFAGARVTVQAAEERRLFESELPGTELLVSPGAGVAFEVAHPISRSVHTSIVAPGPGETRDVSIELQVVERPVLSLRLTGPPAADVGRITLELVHVPTGELLALSVPRQGEEFVVDPLGFDPGKCRLRAQSPSSDGHVFTDEREFLLPGSGRVEVELIARLGGRLEFASAASFSWFPIRLLDATGRDALSLLGPGNSPPASHPLSVARERVLEPGSYRIEMDSPLYEPFRRDLTVQAGATVRVPLEFVLKEGLPGAVPDDR